MRSLKAIVAGSLFIVIVFIILQMAFVIIAVGYNTLAASFPFLKDITGIFRYLVGLPVLIVTTFIGGYITADIADMHTNIKVWLHGFTVGFISVAGMIYIAIGNENLTVTLTGIVVIVVAISGSSAGSLYWLRRINNKTGKT
ncbi:MAG: hypothetical protein OEY78_10890 [Gammaproteobacteria bacterium]|nr:hypothetical protein [Gammaproteobacteria bacterium]